MPNKIVECPECEGRGHVPHSDRGQEGICPTCLGQRSVTTANLSSTIRRLHIEISQRVARYSLLTQFVESLGEEYSDLAQLIKQQSEDR